MEEKKIKIELTKIELLEVCNALGHSARMDSKKFPAISETTYNLREKLQLMGKVVK